MTSRRPGVRKAQDRGAALILVVWAVGLMAVIGALIARDAHLDALEGNRLREALDGQLLVESGQRIALARLAAPLSSVSSGFPIICDLENGRLFIDARPITALVDLNAAQEETLAALFIALGAAAPDAATYAARIADYRDGDTVIRARGAELPDYIRSGLAHGPANRPFNRTGELSEVLGLPPELLISALPHVTTHARSPEVDPVYASREVAAALEIFGSRIGTTLADDSWQRTSSGEEGLFAAEPVVIEVIAQTRSGYRTGRAMTYGPQEMTAKSNRRLIEERPAGPEPVMAAGASLPEPGPCY
jgi:general secretion pathway protein K